MKILVFANGTTAVYKFRKELMAALVASGHTVLLSSPDDGFLAELRQMDLVFSVAPMQRRGTNPVSDALLFFYYLALIKKERPNIILTYTIKPNIYGNLAAKMYEVPVISTVTGLGDAFLSTGILSSVVRFLYRVGFSKKTLIAFQNERDQSIMLHAGLATKSRCFLLNGSGVNLDEFKLCPYPTEIPIVFTYIGRIMKSKGIDELLQAAGQLKEKHGNKAEIWVAGYFDEDYENIIMSYHQKQIIKYLGFQKDIKMVLAQSHCILLPSYQEGMSNALLEAAAIGRPLIATNINGCKEIVHPGLNGFLCEPQNAEQLYLAMDSFMKLSTSDRHNMAKASRNIVEQKFDRAIIVELMMDKINELFA